MAAALAFQVVICSDTTTHNNNNKARGPGRQHQLPALLLAMALPASGQSETPVWQVAGNVNSLRLLSLGPGKTRPC
jgi:hypothetical protein